MKNVKPLKPDKIIIFQYEHESSMVYKYDIILAKPSSTKEFIFSVLVGILYPYMLPNTNLSFKNIYIYIYFFFQDVQNGRASPTLV